MRKVILLLAAMTSAVLVAVGTALADTAPQGTLDVDNLNQQPTNAAGIDSGFASGQTFTVQHSGKLTGVRVLLSKVNSPGDLTVEIANVDAASGFPAVPEDVLASTTKLASTFPSSSSWSYSSLQPVDIVFDTPASVVAGKPYALILKAQGDLFYPHMYVVGSTGDPLYGGGNTYSGGERIYQRCPFGPGYTTYCTTPPTQWAVTNQSIDGPDLIFGIYVNAAKPSAPTINLDGQSDSGKQGDNITNGATPTFNGEAEKDSTVKVYDGDNADSRTLLGESTADANGKWSFTVGGSGSAEGVSTLSDGKHTITATASNGSGESDPSDALQITIDTKAPSVSTVSPAKNTYGVPSSTTVSVKFTEAGSGIDRDSIVANDTFKLEQVKPTGNVPVDGRVECESATSCLNPTFAPNASLPKGAFKATITTGVKDIAGNALENNYPWYFATAGPPSK